MPRLSRAAFAWRLRRLDRAAFERFVADLWRARGYEVAVEGGVVTATDGGETRRLLIDHGSRVPGRRGRPPDADVDAVVTNARRPPDPGAARTIDADDLHGMACYAVDREARDDLLRRHLGRPTGRETASRVLAAARSRRPKVDRSLPRPGRTHALVGLLVLAALGIGVAGAPGTAGLAGGDAADSPSRGGAITPVPVPVPASSGGAAVRGEYPVGLGPDGVLDGGVIARRHARLVTDRSYRLVLTVHEYVHGRLTAARVEVVRVESPTVFTSRVDALGDPEHGSAVIADADTYADGTDRYERVTTGNGTRYRRDSITTGPRVGPVAGRVGTYLGWLLSVRDSWIVNAVERDGTTRYRVALEGNPWSGAENATGGAVIDSEGIVRSVHHVYDVPDADGVSVIVAVRYTDVGNTSVTPPPWYGAAVNATR